MPGIGIGISKYLSRGGSSTPGNIQATGGITSYVTDTYFGTLQKRKIHYFPYDYTGHGFTLFSPSAEISVLKVAGGGGGKNGNRGGAGGGGGVTEINETLTAGNYPVTIGVGGIANSSLVIASGNGGNTTFNGSTVIGGGGGGASTLPGADGGSGGGGGNLNGTGGLGTAGQGFNGGNATTGNNSGGGGGAGAVGGDGIVVSTGGDGGIGKLSSISGVAAYYGGGGGAGGFVTGGTGGLGGGGNGEAGSNLAGTAGTNDLGGGGGSAFDGNQSGLDGGTGCCYISYVWSGPDENYYELSTVNANIATMPTMDSVALVEFDGALWAVNGWNPTAYSPLESTNLSWKSTDKGLTWIEQPAGPYDIMHNTGVGVRSDGYLWIWGRTDFGIFIVYKMDTSGNWTEVSTAGTVVQVQAFCLHKDYMYRVGGQDGAGLTPTMYTDIERSLDGIIWTSVGTTPVAFAGATTICSDGNKLYFGGGGAYRTGEGTDDYDYNPSIWESSDDGANWTVHSAALTNMQTLWPTITMFGSRLFYLVGYDGYSGTNFKGLYYYNDGEWVLMASPSARHATPMCEFQDELFILTGNMHNDCLKVSAL